MAKETQKRIVLLDAHAIIHRAYHALPDFSSSKGEPTGALYGLSAMLIKLVDDLNPYYIAACYDLPSPTHRHEAFEGYKANRKKTDDDLIAQLERSKDVFKAFHIPMYSVKGFEADDVLGTIVDQLKKKPFQTVIASGDMDTLQLVDDEKVLVYTLRKGIKDTVLYDEKAVVARYQFTPTHIPDFKGLSGDPSDNIVGVPGIGEKTATDLILKFGTIEELYKTLKKDKELLLKEGVKPRVVDLLEKHEDEARFSKTLATIRRDAPVEFEIPDTPWKETVRIEDVEKLFKELEFKTMLDRVKDMIGIEKTPYEGGEDGASPTTDKVSRGDLEKTALALWVVDSNKTNPTLADILEFAKKGTFEEAKEVIFIKLKENNLESVYNDIELPLIPIIHKMQERGVLIDKKYLAKLSSEHHKRADELEKEIHKLAGEEFNINSPKQLSVIIFEKLGLSVKSQKKTSLGVKSTKESELLKLQNQHPIIDLVLEYREVQKLLGTYIDAIPKLLHEDDRLRAKFIQPGTTTGRLSSQEPNLQNIPIKTEHGKKIRNAFIAPEDSVLASFDYSQIELRIAAFLSGDEKLIEIFKTAGDIHRGVASEVFKVPRDQVEPEMRRRAKVINFGILYGMGINALKANLGTSKEEAEHFYNEYFKNFSALATYLEKVKYEAAKKGYTETFFGRRRYFPGLHSKLPYVRAESERMAVNAPIQGTEADIVKLAMVKINDMIAKHGLSDDVHLILTVHDELVYEIKKGYVEDMVPKIKDIMESIMSFEDTKGVPILAEAHTGKSWGELK